MTGLWPCQIAPGYVFLFAGEENSWCFPTGGWLRAWGCWLPLKVSNCGPRMRWSALNCEDPLFKGLQTESWMIDLWFDIANYCRIFNFHVSNKNWTSDQKWLILIRIHLRSFLKRILPAPKRTQFQEPPFHSESHWTVSREMILVAAQPQLFSIMFQLLLLVIHRL